ncbi:MAG: MCE family protein [Alphaproteobacteria bacterium]|nr:MCE family protein [Alphaproteobacteria bacterium]
MIKQPNIKMIGLFVCLSTLAMILVLGYFFKSQFNNNETEVVMYFDESTKGLDVGAPVLFKGVKIGEVSEIKIEANLQDMTFLIPVYAKIYNGRSLVNSEENGKEILNTLIDDGLRAQLSINSMITGQLLVELDMMPDTIAIVHDEDSDIYEIPTVSSPFAEISKTLKVMPVAKIAQDVHNITQALNKNLPPLLNKLNKTLDVVDEILVENKNNTAKMVKEIGDAAQEVGNAAEAFDLIMEDNAVSVAQMLESFNAAAQSMKNLTDYLQMYPNALITGKDF